MPFSCPKCHSRNLRYARIQSFPERFWTFFGIHPLRCRECQLRFLERTWRLGTFQYARCPRCWRMDLSRWSLHDYHAPIHVRVLLKLGAQPYRCEYCRVNFASFRRRKQRYRSRYKPGQSPAQAVGSGAIDQERIEAGSGQKKENGSK